MEKDQAQIALDLTNEAKDKVTKQIDAVVTSCNEVKSWLGEMPDNFWINNHVTLVVGFNSDIHSVVKVQISPITKPPF